ncbi:MAG TPA: hypothetical protein VFM93_09965 [Candidatus Limnocylindria bacterium]|nr:hypothetical protein [Candidatus Limnocylindria bacterium]
MTHGPLEHLEEEDREIHLPAPSFAPSIIALGITLVSFGILASAVLIALGGAITLGGIVLWLVEDARVFVQHGEPHDGGHGGH